MHSDLTIGIVSPGAMGSALGRAWAATGVRVVATVAGRSERTRQLAHGLELLPDLDAVLAQATVVCSVVPPGRAVELARTIVAGCRRLGVQPVFADLNAIAPGTVAEIADLTGPAFIDGSISGGPPSPASRTRLYLSGSRAGLLAGLDAPGLVAVPVGERPGVASAIKMCTASVYKGTAGLLSQALQTAEFFGVTDQVLADLAESRPDLVGRAAVQLASAASKSDRYPDEMRQIAQAQAAAGAEPALFEAMAAVFEAVHASALARLTPEQARTATDLAAVLRDLADR